MSNDSGPKHVFAALAIIPTTRSEGCHGGHAGNNLLVPGLIVGGGNHNLDSNTSIYPCCYGKGDLCMRVHSLLAPIIC